MRDFTAAASANVDTSVGPYIAPMLYMLSNSSEVEIHLRGLGCEHPAALMMLSRLMHYAIIPGCDACPLARAAAKSGFVPAMLWLAQMLGVCAEAATWLARAQGEGSAAAAVTLASFLLASVPPPPAPPLVTAGIRAVWATVAATPPHAAVPAIPPPPGGGGRRRRLWTAPPGWWRRSCCTGRR